MSKDFNFSSMHFSVLQELGNMGAGNAVTALSALLNRKIDMNVPKVQILRFDQVSQMIGGAENPVAAVLVNVHGKNVNGIMMFLVEIDNTNVLIGSLMQRQVEKLGDMELSAVKEIGNILTSSYLGALSTVLDTQINKSVPYLSIDMAGSILSVPAIEFAKVADSAIFIESIFATDENDISGYFILVPDQESYNFIFRKLGLAQE